MRPSRPRIAALALLAALTSASAEPAIGTMELFQNEASGSAAPVPEPAIATPGPVMPAPVAPVPVIAAAPDALAGAASLLALALDPAEAGARSALAVPAATRDAMRAFDATREFRPAFASPAGFVPVAEVALRRFAEAKADGLDPADYTRAGLLATGSTPEAIVQRELAFAEVILVYARHASGGRIDPARVHPRHVTVRPHTPEPASVLADMASSADAHATLDGFHPPHPGFLALRRALGVELAAAGARVVPLVQRFPAGPVLRAGMNDPRVALLRQRLQIASADGDTMDAGVVQAVRAFQSQRGLEPTGIVGPNTVRALNADIAPPLDRRIADIVANMERWRWLPRDLGEHHVWVNIPEYLVRVTSGGNLTYEGRAVVGKADTPTPIFSDQMEYLVVNPSWTVPPTLVRTQMMPLLRSDPAALARRGIEVVRARNGNVMFRQPPGERNALGRVKFMFPNDHAVYIHDTPARAYFSHTRRAYSSGCVRVENPARFADAAFSLEENVNGRRIEGLYGPSERHLRLRNRFPVHLVYFTSFVRPDGSLGQAEDIYGFHQRLKELLGLG